MKKDFRYIMSHLGDYMADLLEKTTTLASASAKGVVLTYDIGELKRKRKKLINQLPDLVLEHKKKDPDMVLSRNEAITALLGEIDGVQGRLDALMSERHERLFPDKAKAPAPAVEPAVEIAAPADEESLRSPQAPEMAEAVEVEVQPEEVQHEEEAHHEEEEQVSGDVLDAAPAEEAGGGEHHPEQEHQWQD